MTQRSLLYTQPMLIRIALFALCFALGAPTVAFSADPSPPISPKITSLLKPAVFDRVTKDREIMTHASLDDKTYSYYASMVVRASMNQTRKVLTDYQLYSKLISYIDKAQYDPDRHVLEIVGGIMGYTLHSWLKFEERGDHWIHYTIIAGHFTGLSSDIIFEPLGQSDTLVYMGGTQTQPEWPPKLVMELGAEIVFGFTAKRMRSYINDQANSSAKP
jgi:hypothetical protein